MEKQGLHIDTEEVSMGNSEGHVVSSTLTTDRPSCSVGAWTRRTALGDAETTTQPRCGASKGIFVRLRGILDAGRNRPTALRDSLLGTPWSSQESENETRESDGMAAILANYRLRTGATIASPAWV